MNANLLPIGEIGIAFQIRYSNISEFLSATDYSHSGEISVIEVTLIRSNSG
jgi:hypothetical protein